MNNISASSHAVVDRNTVHAFFQWLFEYAEFDGGVFSLLGIGEKGTPQEGNFRERVFLEPGDYEGAVRHAERWAEHGIGTFVVPAVLARAAQISGDAAADKVMAFTSLVVDIDSGDADQKLEWAARHIGTPSLVIRSGGTTETGHAKLHAWWRLSEQTDETDRIGMLRKTIAANIGGDRSFGRITQIIRVPGSIHGKNGQRRLVEVCDARPVEYDLMDLSEAILEMPRLPGLPVEDSNIIHLPMDLPGGGMDFSAGAGHNLNRVASALTETISEGGAEEKNRWGQFCVVAGHEISNARKGLIGIDEAYRNVCGWVLSKMDPPWPETRIRTEFSGLLNVDVRDKGPIADTARLPAMPDAAQQNGRVMIANTDDLLSWAVHRRTNFDPPPRRVLVEGLIFAAKRHMFVAEGGAGKTFLLMDLALKLAAAGEDSPAMWMGQTIQSEAHDGHVILITGEDGLDEMDHRWKAIDPDGSLRRKAGDRLITLPLDNLGGAFPFVEKEPHTQKDRRTPEWAALLGAMRDMASQGRRISAVIVDTLNSTMHGDENSAQVAAEYVRAIAPICGELEAALIISHHIKKAKEDAVIQDLDDMKAMVRGSSALLNAMRIVIGFWQAADYQKKMKLMGMQPMRNRLYCAGVVKSNVPAFEGVKHLLRSDDGLLVDMSMPLASATATRPDPELRAWLAWCIGWYADQKFYLSRTARGDGSVFKQRRRFHPCLHNLPNEKFDELLDALMATEGPNKIVQRTVANKGTTPCWFDLKANEGKTRVRGEVGREPREPVFDEYHYDHATGCVVLFKKAN